MGEEGNEELLFSEFQLGMMKEFWRQIVLMVAQQCEYINATELLQKLKNG